MAKYGAMETNPMPSPTYHSDLNLQGTVDWADERLDKITRLRLLSDPGYPAWDISYCHGKLKDGTDVRVSLPFVELPKGKVSETIIYYAKKDGVYAKGLGVFNAISTLI